MVIGGLFKGEPYITPTLNPKPGLSRRTIRLGNNVESIMVSSLKWSPVKQIPGYTLGWGRDQYAIKEQKLWAFSVVVRTEVIEHEAD